MISHIHCKRSVSKCFCCSGAVSECSGANSKCSGAVSRDISKHYTYRTLKLELGARDDCDVIGMCGLERTRRPKRECHHMTVIAADNRARFTS